MSLTSNGKPTSHPPAQMLSTTPNVRMLPRLFSAAECRHVATVGNRLLSPAAVVDPKSGRLIQHPIRTSHSAAIGPAQEDLVIHALNKRITAATGTNHDQGEPLIVLRYAPGQEYRAHTDSLPNADNQRVLTVLVYLNDGYQGGETHFFANGLSVAGRTGDAIAFQNVDKEGKPDMSSRHAGLPVIAGYKWLATRWIRATRYDPWNPPPI